MGKGFSGDDIYLTHRAYSVSINLVSEDGKHKRHIVNKKGGAGETGFYNTIGLHHACHLT